jgi:hypothetical protein
VAIGLGGIAAISPEDWHEIAGADQDGTAPAYPIEARRVLRHTVRAGQPAKQGSCSSPCPVPVVRLTHVWPGGVNAPISWRWERKKRIVVNPILAGIVHNAAECPPTKRCAANARAMFGRNGLRSGMSGGTGFL